MDKFEATSATESFGHLECENNIGEQELETIFIIQFSFSSYILLKPFCYTSKNVTAVHVMQ